MFKVTAGAPVLLIAIMSAHVAVAQAPSDSTTGATTTAVALVNNDLPPVRTPMPADVRGYRLTDSVALDQLVPGLIDYSYIRDKKDVIHVFVSAYQKGTGLQSREDTAALVQGEVDAVRQSFEAAYRRGDLSAFRTMREQRDGFRTGGRSVEGYAFIGGLTHRGGVVSPEFTAPPCSVRQMVNRATAGICAEATSIPGFQAYTYYSAFALPKWMIRVRAEMPRSAAVNEEVPDFAHKLVAALVASP